MQLVYKPIYLQTYKVSILFGTIVTINTAIHFRIHTSNYKTL